jgi:hypothetical protein
VIFPLGDLITLGDEDLMSFEDLETEDENSQDTTKHTVVAKHIGTHNIQDTNSTQAFANHTGSVQTNYSQEDKSYNLRSKSPQY